MNNDSNPFNFFLAFDTNNPTRCRSRQQETDGVSQLSDVLSLFNLLYQQGLQRRVNTENLRQWTHRRHNPTRSRFAHDTESEPNFCQRTGRVSYDAADSQTNSHRSAVPVPQILVAEVPISADNSYFEIEIRNTGRLGFISIGLVPEDYPPGNHPGWQHGSIGYHSDDGGIFIQNGRSCKTKEKCCQGDRMGCGIEDRGGRQFVYFTKNGQTVAEQPFGSSDDELYPAVGLNSTGEEIQLTNSEIWEFGTDEDEERETFGASVNVDNSAECERVDISPTGHTSFLWRGSNCRDGIAIGSVPLSQDHTFFELEIFSIPDGCDITVALVPLNYQHGQQQPSSVSFRASDGAISCGADRSSSRTDVNQRCTTGDKMGCGIEYRNGTRRAVYFTRNTQTFKECDIDSNIAAELYPAVVLRSSSTKTVSVCIQDCDNWGFKTCRSTLQPNLSSCPPCSKPTLPARQQSAVTINSDNCTVSLEPNSDGSVRNATLIATKPFAAEVSYFEIDIVAGQAIAVGAVVGDYPLDNLPGWQTGSIGYHSDNGGIYIEQQQSKMFVSKCDEGDSIGCGISHDGGNQKVFFTRNGTTVTELCFGEDCNVLYPAIGLQSKGCQPAVVLILDLASSDLWKEHEVTTQPAAAAASTAAPAVAPSSNASLASGAAKKQEEISPEMREKINRELQCPICWSTLRNPKLLPCCQHTFCFDCVGSFVRDFRGQAKIPCPVCRATFSVPREGVKALENNLIASKLLEIMR